MTYQNCRGVKTKLESLKCGLLNCDSDVVALTETWLNGSVMTSEFCNNKIVVRRDRNYLLTGQKQGGGVLLAIRDTFEVLECDIFPPDIEAICVRISFGFEKFLYIVVVYFVPNSGIQVYNAFYECIETKLLNCDCIVLGDFNLHDYVDNASTKYVCSFNNFLAFTNMTQENKIRNFNNVILDLVLVSPPLQGIKVDIDGDPLLPADQHHPPLIVSFSYKKKIHVCKQISNPKFNFRKADFSRLYAMMLDQNWEIFKTFVDVDAAVSHLYNIFQNIFLECVPMSTHTAGIFPVWFDYGIIKSIKMKEKYYLRYKKTRLAYWQAKYFEIRRMVKVKIKTAYNDYLNCVQNSLKRDPKYFWNYIKAQRESPDIPAELGLHDAKFKGPKEISKGFALFFKSVFSTSDSGNVGHNPSVNGNYAHKFPINRHEILGAIKRLKGDRAVGPDGIPGYVIKGCGEFLIDPLLQVFNLSLKTATYPIAWRICKVVPVFKGGSRSEIKNYRPIAILNTVSKIFELILFDRIYHTVGAYISPAQHGFLPKKSTLSNLLSFTQYVHEAIQHRAQVDVIYTDMEKAFDKVKHSVIEEKLRETGVDNDLIQLIRSYLSHRSQYVEVRGAKSASYESTSGVPQGSNLGPLLFLIAINSITQTVKDSKALIFADDFKLFLEVSSTNDCLRLQNDLDNVSDWCTRNGFNLNINKCACMSYSLKKDTLENDYYISGNTLNRVSVQKDLGVVFDKNLDFIDHISGLIADASRAMGFVIRSTKHFGVDVCLGLFDALVLPKLEYGCVIWSPQYASWRWSIERVHRKFLKYMFLKKFGYYPERGFDHQQLLRLFNRISLEKRRCTICLLTLFKLLKDMIICPEIVTQLPFAVNRVEDVNTRHRNVFYLNCPRTNLYKNSPLYRMCELYNRVAWDIDLTTISIKSFKEIIYNRLTSN